MREQYIRQIIGALVGIGIGIMILYIGFFRTLLLVALGALGWWLCGSREMPSWFIGWLNKRNHPQA